MTATRSSASKSSAIDPKQKTNVEIERPLPSAAGGKPFASDAIADTLRALDIPYIALNPGASYRGLHDSLVNHLGNEKPQMLVCLHEETAVALAHGWAKVTGKPMLVAVHSNVGLMHAVMAIYNCWCDRLPAIILGATGPVDATKRRPWIEWIHTSRDQGALVRNFTKWDDQPSSAGAAREAILRGAWLSQTAPMGPVYINFDAGLQEQPLAEPLPPIDVTRFMPDVSLGVSADAINKAAAMIKAAKHPVIVFGRSGRSMEAWDNRIVLAEALNANVLTDIKSPSVFPTLHPLHPFPPSSHALSKEAIAELRQADLILSFDPIDIAGWFKVAFGDEQPKAKVVHVSADHRVHNGWSMDYQALPTVDCLLPGEPDDVIPDLLKALDIKPSARKMQNDTRRPVSIKSGGAEIGMDELSTALREAVGDRPATLTSLSLSWNSATWSFDHPLDHLGANGGGGLGAGPGNSVGAALALKGTGRLPIAVCGDGDFLMGNTAVWTAVHYQIPMLFVIANNRSFFNDEMHQERMAQVRERPVENRWIGMRMVEPEVDFAAMGRSQGATGFGPVSKREDMVKTFAQAIEVVEAGGVAIVDVRMKAQK